VVDQVVEKLAAGDATGGMIQLAAQFLAEELIAELLRLVEPLRLRRDLPGLAIF
jgi:hypothetical protein